ncbi:reprolysin-like metallopeptidase [Xanthomarina sp.]|uniref:zinc-dependent metalloprotease n=1 Tax=Xanthomarina sp. TaxID=1931211 RepID=UPI002CF79139|nr:zinc-dependent metalloprotease family protein [Xanthomarina sp.]HLV40026.1 zinc-dependent metalloprotease family protein [Xanthomarina sp.]
MKNNYLKSPFLLITIVLFSIMGFSQNKSSFWSEANSNKIDKQEIVFPKTLPKIATILTLDFEGLSAALTDVPKREDIHRASNLIINFPNAEGVLEAFRIKEASVMTPELQAQFPNIRSFVGQGIDNPRAIVRFSFSPEKGLSSMILSDKKTVFIEPYSSDLRTYISFINSEMDARSEDFVCETEYVEQVYNISDEEFEALRNANDGQLRTYRLALACTVEYSLFHGGTLNGVMAAMNTTMTRVNGVYERDMSLTMVMVPNQTIIFLGPNVNSDPYTNANGGAMLAQNQTTCDTNIGVANYDIGHVFSTGGGGVAYLNSPCTGIKAGGVTGRGAPVGDAFDIDYVAHEMGHQYGGNHTQNNNCNRSSKSVEPGSASTIMGYAGICAPNVQNNSDAYFNGDNLKEMWLNISVGNSTCSENTSTGNIAPTANAGADVFIPKSTAFVLRGSSTDSNSDALTYCWEQSNPNPAQMPPVPTSTVGPAFRSLTPSASPDRYMPAFNTVLSGSLASTWEVVPSVARTMNFLLTVRDNAAVGGNTASDNVIVTVVDATPFTVSTPPSWAQNSTQTVNWAVGQSNVAPINSQIVNILFAANGIDFDTTLASGVPNTGTASITVPNISNSNTAKILVEAADNIFYAVSNAFSINGNSDFSISNASGSQTICNANELSYDFTYAISNGFSETTTFSAAISPAITGVNFAFTPTTLNADGTFTLNVTGLAGASAGNYNITVTGTSPSIVRTVTAGLTVSNGHCTSAAEPTDPDRITGVIFNTINNLNPAATNAPYEDFTSISTDVERGSSHAITVNVNTNGNYPYFIKVWIDWNQNCTFDTNEAYSLGTAINVVNQATTGSPLTITVPSDAVLGMTTMRVVMKNENTDNLLPCENGFYGQVEDYSVNIIAPLSVDEFDANTFSVYPNPTHGELYIKLNNTDDINISIIDIRGRRVYNEFNNNKTLVRTLDVSSLASGMYLLNIERNGSKATKKIIIE